MAFVRSVSGGVMLLAGGALSAVGSFLAVILPIVYVEWDAGVRASLTVLAVAAVLAVPGAALNALGGWLFNRSGMQVARRTAAVFLASSGLALVIGPLVSLALIAMEGASYNAPGRSWFPYLVMPALGAAMLWCANRLCPLARLVSLRLQPGDVAAPDHA